MIKDNLFKAAIVGCGNVAGIRDRPQEGSPIYTHAKAYHKHPRFSLVAAASPQLADLVKFKQTWGISTGYATLDEMISSEALDVLSVCTPSSTHAEQLEYVLKSNNKPRVVIAEKPICLKRERFHDLAELASNTNCKVIVNHSRRYDPAHIRIGDLIRSGELGALLRGTCSYYGGWLNNGCHAVDTLRMLLDKEPIIDSTKYGSSRRGDDRCLDVRLFFDGVPIDIISWDESHFQIFEIELRFSDGRILIKDFGFNILVEKAKTNALGYRQLSPHDESPLSGLQAPLYNMVDLVVDYLDGRTSLEGRGILLCEVYRTMDIVWSCIDMAGGER